MIRKLPLWLSLLVAVSDAGAAGSRTAVHEQGTATEADVRAYRDMSQRFSERLSAFQADIRRVYQQQHDTEVGNVRRAFDQRIAEVEKQREQQRQEAVTALETYLRHHDDPRYASDARLRLSELYYQHAKDQWLKDSAAYYAELSAAENDLDKLADLEAQGSPRIELEKVVGLLRAIIDTNRGVAPKDQYPLLDVAYYTLGFVYDDPNSSVHDREKARAVFKELATEHPESDYADAAHLTLGIYLFQDNKQAEAIQEFETVVKRGPTRSLYHDALYQIAWARYKLREYDEALRVFADLLNLSESHQKEAGRPSDYAHDAVTYTALSLLDQAELSDTVPLSHLKAYFATFNPVPNWAWDVEFSLADALKRYGRNADAVDVYRDLQARWPDRPENPDIQDQLAKLLSIGFDADLVAAGAARLEMTEKYGEGSRWWLANRNNPDAQARARRYIEGYLLDVATELKARAQEQGDAALYLASAVKYREYLDKFPVSDDYFEIEYQLADSLYFAGRYDEALSETEQLIKNEVYHPYGDWAAYTRYRIALRMVQEAYGGFDKPVADAGVERVESLPSGAKIEVYALTPLQRTLVDAADALLHRKFAKPTDGSQDIGAFVKANGEQIAYPAAQILFYANRFAEARPRLLEIIQQYPSTDEAAYAATLYVNSYTLEGDFEQVRRWSREFSGMRLGTDTGSLAEKQQFFQSTLEQSTYQLATEAYARGDYEVAAENFLAFARDFPKSKQVPDALVSAAHTLEKLGRVADALRVYEDFLKKFPNHPEAPVFYLRVASNAEATFELQKAIDTYQQIVSRFPHDSNAEIAQYMIAFLYEGLGNASAAAKGYEAYAQRYPKAADVESTLFRAGRQYERVDAAQAVAFYKRYLSAFGSTNPDHQITALARMSALYTQLGRAKEAAAAEADILSAFAAATEAKATLSLDSRDIAAEIAFRPVQALADAITQLKLSGDPKSDGEMLFNKLPPQVQAFDAAADTFIRTYVSIEYTTAAIYLKGKIRAAYAALGLAMEPPDSYSEIEQDAYWQLLETNVFPQMDQINQAAVQFFEDVLAFASKYKTHSHWVDDAQASLNLLDPSEYPAGKSPLVSEVIPDTPLVVAPALLVDGASSGAKP